MDRFTRPRLARNRTAGKGAFHDQRKSPKAPSGPRILARACQPLDLIKGVVGDRDARWSLLVPEAVLSKIGIGSFAEKTVLQGMEGLF
ncbi:MAG: hypothetical protein OXC93_14885 [Rhodospirillaceae bacterium]|nr:hypothetical protein [Rhodospirillaceae bacterium]